MSIASHMRAYGARPFLLGGALLGIVVVSALAVRESMRNAQERKAAAERTVRDYAKFASYLYTTRAYLSARERTLFQAYVAIHPSNGYSGNPRHDGAVRTKRELADLQISSGYALALGHVRRWAPSTADRANHP